MLVGVPDDQSGRSQRQDGDVAPKLVAIEGGLVMDDVGRERLPRQCRLQRVGNKIRLVARTLDVRAELLGQGRVTHVRIVPLPADTQPAHLTCAWRQAPG